jgi:hypothetical protein
MVFNRPNFQMKIKLTSFQMFCERAAICSTFSPFPPLMFISKCKKKLHIRYNKAEKKISYRIENVFHLWLIEKKRGYYLHPQHNEVEPIAFDYPNY